MILGFANFELDDELFELRRDGIPVPIQRKTFDLLLYLARSNGAVLSREELMSKVWPSVVVSEPALTQAILTVRKALGDEGNDPRFVKTVRGRDSDTIQLPGYARYRQVRLCAFNAPLHMVDFDVRFENGRSQDVAVRSRINPGTCTRTIDLKGERRDIQSIRLRYEPVQRGLGRPLVRVQAR